MFRPHEVPYLLGNPAKAKKQLNWEPKVDFKKLAEMMYDADYELIKNTEVKRKSQKHEQRQG